MFSGRVLISLDESVLNANEGIGKDGENSQFETLWLRQTIAAVSRIQTQLLAGAHTGGKTPRTCFTICFALVAGTQHRAECKTMYE